MTDEKVAVEIWKKIVDVQQHFNDLELRIRNFALIVTGAFLAFGGSAIKEAAFVNVLGREVSVAAFIVFAAILPLFAFYFMDKYWYHRLLAGAVKAGAAIESELHALGYEIQLGSSISTASPIPNWFYGKKVPDTGIPLFRRRLMHSKHKMDVFYGLLLAALLTVGISLMYGVEPSQQNATTATTVEATDEEGVRG